MSKKAKAVPEGQVKARVLIDCVHGKCNEVAVLPTAEAEVARQDGLVDPDPAAVAYAESLMSDDGAAA